MTLAWPGGSASLDERGGIGLQVEGAIAPVRLTLVPDPGLRPVLIEPDTAEHAGVGEYEVSQRVTVGEHCQVRWAMELSPQAGGVELEVEVPPGLHCWVWPSGADGLLAVFPEAGSGPVLVMQVLQGSLTWVGEGADGRRVRLALALPEADRQVTMLRVQRLSTLDAAVRRLPAWYQPLAIGSGDDWEADIADLGLDASDPIEVEYPDDERTVRLHAPAGRHRIGIHSRRGVTELLLEVCPSSYEAVHAVALQVLAAGPLSSAGAVVVQHALTHGDLASDRFVEDALDRFDWTTRGDPLAIAFGCHRAVQESERAMVEEAVQQVLVLPDRVQQAQVRRIVAFAAAALDADVEPLLAVMRPVSKPVLADRLHFGRRTEAGAAQLAGAINRLGAGLPGRPVGLRPAAAAELVCLLDACPEHWPEAPLAAITAQEARFKLFAGYAAGDITDPTALAWLLIGG